MINWVRDKLLWLTAPLDKDGEFIVVAVSNRQRRLIIVGTLVMGIGGATALSAFAWSVEGPVLAVQVFPMGLAAAAFFFIVVGVPTLRKGLALSPVGVAVCNGFNVVRVPWQRMKSVEGADKKRGFVVLLFDPHPSAPTGDLTVGAVPVVGKYRRLAIESLEWGLATSRSGEPVTAAGYEAAFGQ